MREHPHQSMTSSDHILATFYSILPFTIPSNTVVAEQLKLCTNTILLGNSIWYNITSVISFANISDGKPRGTASSRGSIFTVLVLVLRVTILVSVLVLHLLSWSCALRPRQFKTPVEKRHQPTDSPVTQLVKYLTVIKREDFDPDEQPAVNTLPQFNSLWPLFLRLWCVCMLLLHW